MNFLGRFKWLMKKTLHLYEFVVRSHGFDYEDRMKINFFVPIFILIVVKVIIGTTNIPLLQYLKTGTMKKPCSCGFNYFFVRSTGELFLCPLINNSLGNVKIIDLKDLFRSEKASQFRRKLGHFPECRRCTEPGLERYALPYQGFTYLSMLLRMGRDEFFQLHRHMGLDKYFN